MKKELKKFLLTCPLALATLLIPISFPNNLPLALVLLTCTSILMLLVEWDYRYIILFILVFVSGPIAEAIAIHFGTWTYANGAFNGIPAWLPFVWGNAGLYIVRLHSLLYSHKSK